MDPLCSPTKLDCKAPGLPSPTLDWVGGCSSTTYSRCFCFSLCRRHREKWTSFTPRKASQSKDWEPLRGCSTRGGGVPRRPFFSSYGEEKWPPYAVQPKLDCKAHTTYVRCGLRGQTKVLHVPTGKGSTTYSRCALRHKQRPFPVGTGNPVRGCPPFPFPVGKRRCNTPKSTTYIRCAGTAPYPVQQSWTGKRRGSQCNLGCTEKRKGWPPYAVPTGKGFPVQKSWTGKHTGWPSRKKRGVARPVPVPSPTGKGRGVPPRKVRGSDRLSEPELVRN